MKIYPTIAEALTLGGSKLAVDGVVLVGEHGHYPRNEKGQTKYPRYEFFQQIVKVFRDSGRSVPVFNDKHLSWNWEWAKEMYDTSREMGFPFMAGSSLPVTWRTPSVEMPLGARVREALVRLLRRRGQLRFPRPGNHPVHGGAAPGGETGVKWMQAYRGDKFWEAYAGGRLAARADGGRAVPQPHADAGAATASTTSSPRSTICGALVQGPGGLPLRARRRPEVHHAADERTGAGFQLRRDD